MKLENQLTSRRLLTTAKRVSSERNIGKTLFGSDTSKIAGASIALSEVTAMVQRTKSWYRSNLTYNVSVSAEDPLYGDVIMALYEMRQGMGKKEPRSIAAGTRMHSLGRNRYDDDIEVVGSTKPKRSLFTTYDDEREQRMVINGVPVSVSISKDAPAGSGSQRGATVVQQYIIFNTATAARRDAIVRWLGAMVEATNTEVRVPSLMLMNSWGGWSRRSDLPLRTFDSVVLRNGQAEELIDDLGGFLEAESEYVRRGIPWHRGYLLHGPPGTGKTSAVKALSDQYGLDLWYAPLNDVDKDSNLLTLISEVKPHSILLLEDIDVFSAARDREENEASEARVSTSGLLNALDGVSTPHGLITVMTTNYIERLDPALRRPGRIDRFEYFPLLDAEQAQRFFRVFYGEDPPVPIVVGENDSPAELGEILKRHMNSPLEGALAWNSRSVTVSADD